MKAIKILTGILSALLFLTGAVHASSWEWADDMIEKLLQRRIVDETPENLDEYITREEFCVMLAKAALRRETDASLKFDEKRSSAIFEDGDKIKNENYPYIIYLYEKQILEGILTDGKLYMMPDGLITRQEAAALMGRWLSPDTENGKSVTPAFQFIFTDDIDISDYAYNIIYQLLDMNIINGYPDGSFRPLNNITFAETSSLIYKSIAPVIKFQGTELKTYFGYGTIGNADGADFETRFAIPSGLCFDNYGNLIVFDTYNASVKRIKDNKSETILGFSGIIDDYGFMKPRYLDAVSEKALFGRPIAGVYAPNNDLFIVDSENNAVRLLRGDTVYTFAGKIAGFADGKKSDAKFNYPMAITIDKTGDLYVADTYNHCIRKITADGTVSTLAGVPEKNGFNDGDADKALFCEPSGIAVDDNGVIYVADTGNHVIRKIEGTSVTTIAGIEGDFEEDNEYRTGGYDDGPAQNARFNFPRGIFYAEGILFIADTENHAVRALDIAGNNTVSTVAGSGESGDEDGPQGIAMMNKPTSVAYSDGVLYIADSFNNKIKSISINFNN